MHARPYWWDTVDAALAPAEEVPPRADVAIIGGGYTGLSAARRLARSGAAVVLFEQGQPGSGASSRNAGQVLTGLRLDPAALVARYGEAGARELFGISLQAIADLEVLIEEERIDCGYHRAGHIQAAATPSHFDAFHEEQALLARVFNHQVSVVPRSDQHAELASDRYHGLLIDERSGALNPARYAAGLASAAAHAGAILDVGTTVDRVERSSTGWLVSTAHGRLEAREVLVATNGYTGGATPWLRRRFVPVGSYIVVTEPLGEAVAGGLVPRRRMAFDTRYFLFYFRVLEGSRLLFGGRAEFSNPSDASLRRAVRILQDGITQVFPQLDHAPVASAWSGNVAFTRDEMPRAGRVDGAWYAGGYGGHGVAMATYLGDLIARRIAGERIDHPLMDDRFPPIPFYNGRPWFLPFVGTYYRMKDWLG